MLFYFVRHGETEANARHILAGSGQDHPLNETGHAQARALGQVVKDLIPHKLHKLHVSSMTRARQTAQYIQTELALEIEVHPEFREWHLGEWEGKSFHEFGHLLIDGGEPREGESRKAFYARIDQAWRKVHSDNEPYMVVAHGGVWLAMQDLLKIPRFKASNCNLIKVQSDGDTWSAEILNCG